MKTKVMSIFLVTTLFAVQTTYADRRGHKNNHPIFVLVKANKFFNTTGINAAPGESFLIKADGIVDISTLNGSYLTEPDGTLVMTTKLGAFEFFRDRASPLNTDPIMGSRKSFFPLSNELPGHLPGAPYGALVAGFSTTTTPTSFNDFQNGFALINNMGVAIAPNTGGYLFLGVNDFNNPGGDNAGEFKVRIYSQKQK